MIDRNRGPFSEHAVHHFHAMIVDRLDGSRQARLDRIDQMATLFIGTIAGWEWRRRDGLRAPDHQALLADLTATCLAVLVAPTRHPLETRT